MRQTIDTFLKKQHMTAPDYELYNYVDPDLPLIEPHRHTFYEVYYVRSEQLEYVIGNRIYSAKKGDVLLLPPGELHYPSETNLYLGKQYSRIILWCSLEYYDRLAEIEPSLREMWDIVRQNHAFHYSPTASNAKTLYDRFLILLSVHQKGDYAVAGRMFAILLELFCLLAHFVCESQYKYKKEITGTDDLFVNVIFYIHTHLSEDLSLDHLARHFWVSKVYLSRMFREYIGMPVHQYILSFRLDSIRNALDQGVPVMQAAEQYGFRDYSSFYRAFRKAFSVSPREYQSSLRM